MAAAALVVAVAALALALWSLRRAAGLERSARRRGAPDPPPASVRSLQNVGVVRFNPYHDTGGDYSFAVALLDAGGDGVLLTGLYHRDRCRVYAKPVRAWDSPHTLTDEERQAIGQARGGEPGRE